MRTLLGWTLAVAMLGAVAAARPKAVPKLPTPNKPAASQKVASPAAPAIDPQAPKNLAITPGALAENQLELRWDPVPGALGYEVLVKRDGRWHLNEDDPSYIPMTNSTSLTGLPAGSEVEIAVRTVLPQGVSGPSPALLARTAEPGVPLTVSTPAPPSRPLPLPETEPVRPTRPTPDEPALAPIPVNAPINDLVPPPPKPKPAAAAASEPQKPKGPPPQAPEGLLGVFASDESIRLSWRTVRDASGYVVEEEKDGLWIVPEDGVILENRASLLLKKHQTPGPYFFRVSAVRYGARSGPSLPVKVER